ncbi:MAG: dTMP kinase [Gemmatimonadaceae bacterium]
MTRGPLIVFEGAEGVGKTTQARRLVAAIELHGHACEHLREPGGTSLGESIRSVLLEPFRTITASAEALLFMASRAQLVSERIEPALTAGTVVVLDRFFLSTYAYQIHGRGLAASEVVAANKLAVAEIVPTITVVLGLPAGDGLARAGKRAAHDYMEQLGSDFHARVEAAFDEFVTQRWQSAHPECGPIAGIDASGSEDEVFARVAEEISRFVPAGMQSALIAGVHQGVAS